MSDHLGLFLSTSIDGDDITAEKSNDRENRKADREKEIPKPHGDGWIGQSYGSNYHTWTRGNDQIIQMWDGEKWLQQYRNLDQTGTGHGLSSSPFAITSTYADPIIDFMEFMFLTVSPLPIINVGGFKSIGAFKTAKIFKGGKTFAQFKAVRGGTETLAKISTSTGTQRISTEFHHAFLTQRLQNTYNLPNWMVNNRLNVWKLNTVQHSLIDPYRYNFLRAGFKPDVGFFKKYNWFTKF